VNRFPLRLGPGLPSLGDDLETIRASWRRLLDEGVTTVYPAHGRPFPVGALRIGR
jgi:glyoxylase-like metal-dependent hydrolase (beta-lactamase superfamily II)